MLIFTEEELAWIKKDFENVMKIYNGDSAQDIRDLIEAIDGECLDIVILFNRNNYRLFNIVNTNEYFNKKAIDYLWEGNMWYWCKEELTTAEEVKKYMNDDTYCQLYEKIFNYYYDGDEDELEYDDIY
ncbi:MAG: hypothetical protein N4A63_08175 [Vallitalea sp.]|jgi:hypothetical protein|nr:hypothetical protein [Vallitalea sp.]